MVCESDVLHSLPLHHLLQQFLFLNFQQGTPLDLAIIPDDCTLILRQRHIPARLCLNVLYDYFLLFLPINLHLLILLLRDHRQSLLFGSLQIRLSLMIRNLILFCHLKRDDRRLFAFILYFVLEQIEIVHDFRRKLTHGIYARFLLLFIRLAQLLG